MDRQTEKIIICSNVFFYMYYNHSGETKERLSSLTR